MAKIKFLKNGIRYQGKYIRVFYSKGSYSKESGFPEGTITIYARDYSSHLPPELKPQNDSDMQTDYFEKDRARISPNNKYYNEIKKFVKV